MYAYVAMQKHTTRIAHTLPLAHMTRRTLIKASCKASNVACIFFWGVCACAGVRLIRTVANQSVSIHLWLLLHPVQHSSDAGITAAGDVLDCWRQHCKTANAAFLFPRAIDKATQKIHSPDHGPSNNQLY